jgi:hypothetical protein
LQEPLAPGETDFAEFWRQAFSPPSAPRRGEGAPAAGSEAQFVHFGPKGPQHVQDIAMTAEQDLPKLTGDVMLDITPGRYRAGASTSSAGSEVLSSAQLRLDVRQTLSFLGILPLAAWATAAAIALDKGGKLPSSQGLDFTTVAGQGAANKILLPGGMGSIQLNLSVANKPSPFLKVLDDLAKAAQKVVPILMPALGLPSISVVALEGFSIVCGKLEGRGKFLLSTAQPQEIVLTQDAWTGAERTAKAVAFPPGDYLMYPNAQTAILLPEFNDVSIESGYLINRKLDPKLTIDERAAQTAKGLTYVTLRVNASAVKSSGSSKTTDGEVPSTDGNPKPKRK